MKRIAGFTMIELLIVITILGILSVAVLSAINPIEQINRGRDTGSKSDAEQLLGAIDRYNAFNGYYPWQTNPSNSRALAWTLFDQPSAILDVDGVCPISDKLSAGSTGCLGSDELKVTFFNRIFGSGYNHLYIYNNGSQGDSTYVCFKPQSRIFKTEAVTRCGNVSGDGLPEDIVGAARTAICEDADDPNAADANIYICLP